VNLAVGYVVAIGRGTEETKFFGVREEKEREKAEGKGRGAMQLRQRTR
jgi:hypothetical protein